MTKKIEPLFRNTKPTKGSDILNAINANKELEKLEIQGFMRGDEKGKTMNTPLSSFNLALKKQLQDWEEAYIRRYKRRGNIAEMKRALADIRNVAGATFLKLLEGGKRK